MKVQIRTFLCGFIVPALAVFLAACGGKESVASKSAAAYAEAQAKSVPVGSEHGGHSPAAGEQSTSAGMDHSKMSSGDMAGMDHSKMGSSNMAGMDHSKMSSGDMAGMDHSKMSAGDMAGMDHSKMSSGDMAGMDHSKMTSGDMAGMDHSKMSSGDKAGMDHSSMSGMNHGAVPSGGLWGSLPGSLAGGGEAPDHSAMAGMNHPPSEPAPSPSQTPGQTLREDNLDRPAPISVSETLKSSGAGHDMDAMGGAPVAAPSSSTAPRAAPKKQVESSKSTADQVIYTCLMHPEVVSSKPGKCPKCGMNLVKKEKK